MSSSFHVNLQSQAHWFQWYQIHEQQFWNDILPNFLLSHIGLTSIPLFCDYYLAVHNNRTSKVAYELWLKTLSHRKNIRLNTVTHPASSLSYFQTFQSVTYSAKTVPTKHYYNRETGKWRSFKFFKKLLAYDSDECLVEQYTLLLDILGDMLQHKLGDPFMIHHVAIQLIEGTPFSCHEYWPAVFAKAASSYDHDVKEQETLLSYGWRYQSNHESYYSDTEGPVFAKPLEMAERSYFTLVSSDNPSFAKKDGFSKSIVPTSKSASAKKAKGTPFTNDNKQIVKEFLHWLDQLALQEIPSQINVLTGNYSRCHQWIGSGGLRYIVVDDTKLLFGPFNIHDTNHRLAIGRTFFRLRKLKEWFAQSSLLLSFIEIPDVSLIRISSVNDASTWLCMKYSRMPYMVPNKTHFPSIQLEGMDSGSKLLLQLFRCLLGIADNTFEPYHTLELKKHQDGGPRYAIGCVHTMRTPNSYDIRPLQQQHFVDETLDLQQIPISLLQIHQSLLFSTNLARETKHIKNLLERLQPKKKEKKEAKMEKPTSIHRTNKDQSLILFNIHRFCAQLITTRDTTSIEQFRAAISKDMELQGKQDKMLQFILTSLFP